MDGGKREKEEEKEKEVEKEKEKEKWVKEWSSNCRVKENKERFNKRPRDEEGIKERKKSK